MSDRIIAALIVGVSVIAEALWGGRYSTSQMPQGGVYVVDRFSGNVTLCLPKECRPIHWNDMSEAFEELIKKATPPTTYDEFLKGKPADKSPIAK